MSYTIYYHTACEKFYGRAIGIVLSLEEAKAKGKAVSYVVKTPDAAPTDVGFATPMMTLPSGQSMAQTPAILGVLGSQLALGGTTDEEKVKCAQAVLDVEDIFSEVISGKWTAKPERPDKWFALLEAKLASTKYLAADEPTIADFHAIFAFEWVNAKHAAGYAKFPKLTQWWAAINAYPTVKALRDNGIPMIPI
eukprot:CAMPEP_0197421792 /NCGR_PEP_ID=MMETSP1170-20131217/11360_1 /TAXON_ID=54406 /ORGANISM="Sarcinochrysis sp, Strain CCMP770" /LENGTH=193 /DNA_ID=CAMNT_0042949073 /DNA_START=15 /DNA_END=596 /DNA_ORIENTATION=+